MIINYMSDIHTEFERGDAQEIITNGGDLLILAGDISIKSSVEWTNKQAKKFKDVVLIDGNHEFYHGNISKTHKEIKKQLSKNIHYLEKETHNINGVNIHGTTLWGGYHRDGSIYEAQSMMNDHRIISDEYGIFTADRARALHNENVDWLYENIKEGDVVVTHHAPSIKSIDLDRYGDYPINAAYYDDLEELILNTKPSLWFHGHVHHTIDYTIGDTRVLCNPRGYIDHEENLDFNLNATVGIK